MEIRRNSIPQEINPDHSLTSRGDQEAYPIVSMEVQRYWNM